MELQQVNIESELELEIGKHSVPQEPDVPQRLKNSKPPKFIPKNEVVGLQDVSQKLKDLFPAGSEFRYTKPTELNIVNKNRAEPNQGQNFSVEVTVTANGNNNKYSGECDSNGTPTGEWNLQRGQDPAISIKFREKDNSFIEDKAQLPKVVLGEYTFANGDKYKGEWRNGERDGKGEYTFASGDKYKGEFKNDKRDGKGECTYANGKRYKGEFKNGKRDGKGIFIYKNGDKYEGEWRNGERDGKGKYTSADGEIYEGEWRNGKMHGKGIFTSADGDKYVGEWINDKKHIKPENKIVNSRANNLSFNPVYVTTCFI